MSDAFLMISRGFAQVATIMGSNELSIPLTHSFDSSASSIYIPETVTAAEAESASSNAGQVSVETPQSRNAAKKVKKEKDPNAPKRPLNAFFLFQRDHKDSIKPTETQTHQVLLKAAWDNLDPEVKNKYSIDAKALYDQFSAELKEYNLKNGQKDTIDSEAVTVIGSTEAEETKEDIVLEGEDSQLKKEKKKKRKSEAEAESEVNAVPVVSNQEGSESPSKKLKKKEKKQHSSHE